MMSEGQKRCNQTLYRNCSHVFLTNKGKITGEEPEVCTKMLHCTSKNHIPLQSYRRVRMQKIPPDNISATARFITNYMARLRRLQSFKKAATVKAFSVTMVTDSVRPTTIQVIHPDEETI